MSTFKDQVAEDLNNVFFSELEEFWEEVEIKVDILYKKIKGIFDNDELIRRTVKKVYQETTQNLNKDKKLLLCVESEFVKKPSVNTKIIVNKEIYTVTDVDSQMGLLVIQLEKNIQVGGLGNGKV